MPLCVHRVGNGEQTVVRALGNRIAGLCIHWIKVGVYCPGPSCPAAIHKVPLQWRGYFAGERWWHDTQLWYPCVVEVTAAAELVMRERFQRGSVWLLNRDRYQGRNPSELKAELLELVNPATLSLPFDVHQVLRRTYGVPEISLDQVNPMEPKVWVTGVPDRPPVGHEPPPPPAPMTAEEIAELRAKAASMGLGKNGTNGRTKGPTYYR